MARAIWSGAINFGLVSVPVKLFTAVKPKDIAFHQVDEKTGARMDLRGREDGSIGGESSDRAT